MYDQPSGEFVADWYKSVTLAGTGAEVLRLRRAEDMRHNFRALTHALGIFIAHHRPEPSPYLLRLRRDHHGTQSRTSTIDTEEPETGMTRLSIGALSRLRKSRSP